MKCCTKCKEFKPFTCFGNKSWVNKDGSKTSTKKSHCRDCVNKSNLSRFHNNKNTKEAHKRASYKHRLKSYGLTPTMYEELWEIQKGRCSICKTLPVGLLSVDHCHKSGKVRGLLCHNCNTALGHTKEDKIILQKMIEYLDIHNADFCI